MGCRNIVGTASSMLGAGRRKWLWAAVAAWLVSRINSQADLPVCEVCNAPEVLNFLAHINEHENELDSRCWHSHIPLLET